MKQKVGPGLVAGALILVVAVVAYFGWRTVTGGPNGDVTSQQIKHWQEVRAQSNAQKMSMSGAAKMGAPVSARPGGSEGAPVSAAPMGGAPMGGAPMGGNPAGRPSGAPMGGAPYGAPMGGAPGSR